MCKASTSELSTNDHENLLRLKSLFLCLQIGRITNNKIEINGPLGWGAMCAGTVDINTANVVCRETRTLFAKSIQNRTARAHGILYNGSVECKGEELTLSDCKLSLAVSNCSNGVVEVICSKSKLAHQNLCVMK